MVEYQIYLYNRDRKLLVEKATPGSPMWQSLVQASPESELAGGAAVEPSRVSILCPESSLADLKKLAQEHCASAVAAIEAASRINP